MTKRELAHIVKTREASIVVFASKVYYLYNAWNKNTKK